MIHYRTEPRLFSALASFAPLREKFLAERYSSSRHDVKNAKQALLKTRNYFFFILFAAYWTDSTIF
jgi:hypothetical protein